MVIYLIFLNDQSLLVIGDGLNQLFDILQWMCHATAFLGLVLWGGGGKITPYLIFF